MCDVSAAADCAACHGHLNEILFLLRHDFEESDDEDGSDVEYYELAGPELMKKMMVAATENRHLQVVGYLLTQFTGVEGDEMDADKMEILKSVVVAGARVGYLDAVKLVLPVMLGADEYRAGYERRRYYDKYKGWREALTEAARNGHLVVVMFLADVQDKECYVNSYVLSEDALGLAIAGGHDEVVKYLLDLDRERFRWNLINACTEVVKRDNKDLAEFFYNNYAKYVRGTTEHVTGNLFVDLAIEGRTEAVKFMYVNGHDDAEIVCDAFVNAVAVGRRVEVVEFLLETGHIFPAIFDKGFVAAASSMWVTSKIVCSLYAMKRASAKTINNVFAVARDMAVMKLLYENERISDEAIIKAFQRAGCLWFS
ncbi:hypothetical protein PHYBOEH_001565 [Phytophthora boehmeriae]|uniref:Ankyrin repeat-containing domain n=1 Tax=Phytophthora boehmeriae TaxID=109152 RepID=A0A8T1VA07_9STRA|nr:hypothetical protein PHYBOEH_001565 [Phytophthora boehmeriae]